jgi:hypothetical protein
MLKKLILSLLLIILLLPAQVVNAASSALSGPSSIRVGDTITLTLSVSATKMTGIQGSIKYNTSQLSFVSYTDKLPTAWTNDYNQTAGNINFVAIDSKATSPLLSATVATIKFKVKDLTVGTSVSVNVVDGVAALVAGSSQAFSASYTKSISSPLSTNANLSALSLNNATLTPKFSSTTTTYETAVPFTTDSLSINAIPADNKAKVTVSNNKLVAGKTTNVSVIVTAQSGAKKTYTIKASREQDPNYVPSTEKRLKAISINQGRLSPAFAQDIYDYVVYVPYEVSQISIEAEVLDPLASYRIEGYTDLMVGNNLIKVVGIAENKEEQNYQLTVVRAPLWGQPDSNTQTVAVNKLLTEMNATYDNEQPIFFQLRVSENQQLLLPVTVLERLKQFTNATLKINYGDLLLLINSKDLTDSFQASYDMSLFTTNPLIDAAKAALGDPNASIIQLGSNTALPGITKLNWSFKQSYAHRINIYRYLNDKLYLVAEDMSIDLDGYLSFKLLEQGIYLVSDKVVSDSIPDVSIKIQNISGWYDDPIKFGGAVIIGLLVLWILGLTIGKERLRKRYLSVKKQLNAKEKPNE